MFETRQRLLFQLDERIACHFAENPLVGVAGPLHGGMVEISPARPTPGRWNNPSPDRTAFASANRSIPSQGGSGEAGDDVAANVIAQVTVVHLLQSARFEETEAEGPDPLSID